MSGQQTEGAGEFDLGQEEEGLLPFQAAVAALDRVGGEVEKAVGIPRVLLARELDLLVRAQGVEQAQSGWNSAGPRGSPTQFEIDDILGIIGAVFRAAR